MSDADPMFTTTVTAHTHAESVRIAHERARAYYGPDVVLWVTRADTRQDVVTEGTMRGDITSAVTATTTDWAFTARENSAAFYAVADF